MSLRKAVKDLTPAAEAMVDAAPAVEKKPAANTKLRGRMVQLTITMTPEDLTALDKAAEQARISRAGFVRNAIFKEIERK